jgi:hypothetical protein
MLKVLLPMKLLEEELRVELAVLEQLGHFQVVEVVEVAVAFFNFFGCICARLLLMLSDWTDVCVAAAVTPPGRWGWRSGGVHASDF